MRPVSNILSERLEKKFQTIAENANPATYLRVMRHEIPLAEKQYLEYSRVGRTNGITDSDVAVCHPKFGKADEDIWVAYIVNNKLKVRYANNVETLSKSDWIEYSYTPDAVACSIAFDSVAKHNARDIWEFVTDKYPWVFWVTPQGALKAKMCTPVGVMEVELAAANVTDVSAVRGPSGEYGNWNLGLTVFYVMGGFLFYKQYINGEWYDSEMIEYSGIQGLTISKIKAFNTWDYRVGVQILTTDNDLYELFSYTEGIGTRMTEHLEINGVSATVDCIPLEYHDGEVEDTHIKFTGISPTITVLYAFSAVPVSASNYADSDSDWGRFVRVQFDYPNTAETLSPSMFALEDSNNNHYPCLACSMDNGDLLLEFDDFNLAGLSDNVTISYTKPSNGGLQSPAVPTNSFTFTFVPINLEPPQIDPPAFASASVNSAGMVITVVLTEEMKNESLSGLESHFSVSLSEYTYVPDGSLETTTRSVASIAKVNATTFSLTLTPPNVSSAIGDITVIYDGLGGIAGLGGPMQAFSEDFTPVGLTWKGHQNDVEHIRLTKVESSITLIPLTYYDAKLSDEHIRFTGIGATVTLTDVHDI